MNSGKNCVLLVLLTHAGSHTWKRGLAHRLGQAQEPTCPLPVPTHTTGAGPLRDQRL